MFTGGCIHGAIICWYMCGMAMGDIIQGAVGGATMAGAPLRDGTNVAAGAGGGCCGCGAAGLLGGGGGGVVAALQCHDIAGDDVEGEN